MGCHFPDRPLARGNVAASCLGRCVGLGGKKDWILPRMTRISRMCGTGACGQLDYQRWLEDYVASMSGVGASAVGVFAVAEAVESGVSLR